MKKTYNIWAQMKYRCDNPNSKDYPRYGGRGITYQKSWKHFENFLTDMGECPKGLTLDRINNSGPYSKDNCQWTSRKMQSRNTTTNTLRPDIVACIHLAKSTAICSDREIARQLSKIFNIPVGTIRNVLSGTTWTDE